MSEELKRLIDGIPGDDGFWVSSSSDKYERAAERLAGLGWSANEVFEFLYELYWAAASCYGA